MISSYCDFVTSFGGHVEALAASLSAKDLLGWMKREVKGLAEFVLRASDFAALSCANNMLSSLCKTGCRHFHDFMKKSFEFEAPNPSNESIKEINIGAKRFIRDFWKKFGRGDARRLAESCGDRLSRSIENLPLRICSFVIDNPFRLGKDSRDCPQRSSSRVFGCSIFARGPEGWRSRRCRNLASFR